MPQWKNIYLNATHVHLHIVKFQCQLFYEVHSWPTSKKERDISYYKWVRGDDRTEKASPAQTVTSPSRSAHSCYRWRHDDPESTGKAYIHYKCKWPLRMNMYGECETWSLRKRDNGKTKTSYIRLRRKIERIKCVGGLSNGCRNE